MDYISSHIASCHHFSFSSVANELGSSSPSKQCSGSSVSSKNSVSDRLPCGPTGPLSGVTGVALTELGVAILDDVT